MCVDPTMCGSMGRCPECSADPGALVLADPMEDVCTCGHYAHEHVEQGSYLGRCTVCTCNEWDWDIDGAAS